MSDTRNKRRDFFIKFLGFCAAVAVLAGFAIIIFFFSMVLRVDMTQEFDINKFSTIGEFFGGTVGSIWALAGVILFYLALIYQRRELELQREELVESRQILNHQSQTIEIQQFENTFFQLLDFHLESSKRIQSQEGGNGFDNMFDDFKKALSSVKRKRKSDGGSRNLDEHAMETSFRNVYDGYRHTLSHYIANYNSLIFLVSEKSKDPDFYMNLIKPHLSEQEVLIQFFFLVLYSKNKKVRSIVERFGLFERLNKRAVQSVDKLLIESLKESAYIEIEQEIPEDNKSDEESEK